MLDCSLFNKSSAFPEEERRDFGLVGLLPAHVSTLEEQAARRYREYLQKPTELVSAGNSGFATPSKLLRIASNSLCIHLQPVNYNENSYATAP